MEIIVWIGTALSIVGLIGIGYSVAVVIRARRAGLPDEELRAKMTKVLPVNLIALLVSTIGLMSVVIGVMLS